MDANPYVMLKSGYLLTMHPAAPLYTSNDPGELFRQVLVELGNLTDTEEVRTVIRQTALVSLWFFLKYVAGYDGPYNELNTEFDLNLANFRQSAACMDPGVHFAIFAPRKHHKSTIACHGANSWEICRDPDHSIMLSHAVREQAEGFYRITKETFESNAFFRWLFGNAADPMGCFCPSETRSDRFRWNDNEIVVPNRTRRQDAATLECLSVGGTAQGKHPKYMCNDDLIGENDLNAERGSSADMWRAGNWLKLNKRALPLKSGRVGLMATRYAPDDIYEDTFQSVRERFGYWPTDTPEEYDVKVDGEWNLYYRLPIEDGNIVHPGVFSHAEAEAMQKDDWWTWATQMENKPWNSGLAELHGYEVGHIELEKRGDSWLVWRKGAAEPFDLADMDVVQTGDPAGAEKYSSARTSRNAQGVVAQDHEGRIYILSLHADYCPITRLFDWYFEDMAKFKGYIRATYPEAQGGFKALIPLLQKEEHRRKAYLNMTPVAKIADKDTFIRQHLVPLLEPGKLYIEESCRAKFTEELAGFPQSRRKDVLDVVSLAVAHSIRPYAPAEIRAHARQQEYRDAWSTKNVTGY